jgi:hypothetical protein
MALSDEVHRSPTGRLSGGDRKFLVAVFPVGFAREFQDWWRDWKARDARKVAAD